MVIVVVVECVDFRENQRIKTTKALQEEVNVRS